MSQAGGIILPMSGRYIDTLPVATTLQDRHALEGKSEAARHAYNTPLGHNPQVASSSSPRGRSPRSHPAGMMHAWTLPDPHDGALGQVPHPVCCSTGPVGGVLVDRVDAALKQIIDEAAGGASIEVIEVEVLLDRVHLHRDKEL